MAQSITIPKQKSRGSVPSELSCSLLEGSASCSIFFFPLLQSVPRRSHGVLLPCKPHPQGGGCTITPESTQQWFWSASSRFLGQGTNSMWWVECCPNTSAPTRIIYAFSAVRWGLGERQKETQNFKGCKESFINRTKRKITRNQNKSSEHFSSPQLLFLFRIVFGARCGLCGAEMGFVSGRNFRISAGLCLSAVQPGQDPWAASYPFKKKKQERFSWSLFIFKCGFTAFSSGLRRCQYSKPADWFHQAWTKLPKSW